MRKEIDDLDLRNNCKSSFLHTLQKVENEH